MIQGVDIVQGLSFGDEGKGKCTANLAQTGLYTHCVRFNGGPNAGHTIHLPDGRVAVTHSIPSGMLFGMQGVIGPGCVLNVESLLKEIDDLEAQGFDIASNLWIHPNVQIITDEHIALDQKHDQIGSTGRGISRVYSDKSLRVGRLADSEQLLAEFIIDDPFNFWESTDSVLAEGAQGIWLDPDIGNYPFVTSSSCLPGAINSLGIPVSDIQQIWGVAKAYDTYVGKMKFQDLDDPDLNLLQSEGKEFGATTGRVRQCNWLNIDKLCQAINITGTTQLVVNKVDILEDVGIFKLNVLGNIFKFDNLDRWMEFVSNTICGNTHLNPEDILFSGNPIHILEMNN